MIKNNWPKLGCGLGLRTIHYEYVLKHWPKNVDWFEAISENYMDTGGRPLEILEKVRARYPVALHGVSLSIGSVDPLNQDYLKKLKVLADRIKPAIVSDHLCWTGVDGKNIHDLLPLPYTEEAVNHLIKRVKQVQDFLGRKILLENVSTYFTYKHSRLEEWDFLTAVAEGSGCGILLDVNNAYVNAMNHGFDAQDFLKNIPVEIVGQFHLAGHTNMGDFLFDTHSKHVASEVWDLYRSALERFGQISTLVEWDEDIPDFDKLSEELEKARIIYNDVSLRGGAKRRRSNLCGKIASLPSVARDVKLFELQRTMKESILPSKKVSGAVKKLGKLLNKQGKIEGIKRISVYADGYIARIHGALTETYPGVRRILGEHDFLALNQIYAEVHPSEYYSLNHAGKHFPRFLAKSSYGKKLSFLPDLAALEWSIAESFHASQKLPLDAQKLKDLPPEKWARLKIHFQPSVSLLISEWPVLDIWNARKEPLGKIQVDLVDRPQNVLVYRQELQVRCELVDKNQAALLKLLISGKSLGKALEIFSSHNRAENLPLTQWFADWSARGLTKHYE